MSQDAAFVQAIIAHPKDQSLRLIYADWLEEHDDPRATFLRVEAELFALPEKDTRRSELLSRLPAMRSTVSPAWLAVLDRTSIENCGSTVQFRFKCPRRWEDLEETKNTAIRHCETCQKNVYYCGTVAEARQHATNGNCVAVDSRLERSPNDLGPPRMTLGIIRPSNSRRPVPTPRATRERPLRKGSEVTITGGTYAGSEGRITRIENGNRRAIVRILVDEETRFVSVDLDDLEEN